MSNWSEMVADAEIQGCATYMAVVECIIGRQVVIIHRFSDIYARGIDITYKRYPVAKSIFSP